MATMEEEALKKNTDCVYFLASPLTCKKGIECEFRHSESARINPRDCWYWLGGKCLMVDCPFRHPPLDGRPVTSGPSTGTVPARASAVTKATTPCFFFCQGYCAKGDKCLFQHGGSTGPASSGQQPGPNIRASKPAYAGHVAKQAGHNVTAIVKMEEEGAQEGPGVTKIRPDPSVALVKNSLPQVEKKEGQNLESLQNGSSKGRPEAVASSKANRPRVRQLHSGDERISNGLKGEDCWEESSPGFDVLVNVGPDQFYDESNQRQSEHEAFRSGHTSQRKGLRMYPTDEFDEYGMGGVDQSGFVVGGQYNHAGYGHESPNPMLYSQGMPFGMRVSGPEGGRDRMVLDFGKDQKQMLKRQRSDGHSAGGKNTRRPRIEAGQDNYVVRRMQEEAQRSHELHLRHQLVVQQQQGVGKGKPNNGRRAMDRLSAEMGRRLEQNPNMENLDRSTQNGGMGLTKPGKLKGEGDKRRMDSDRRLQSETAIVVGDRRGHQIEQKKETPASFAGPKSLAQILAEKRKAAATTGGVVESNDSPVEPQKREESSSTAHDNPPVHIATPGDERKLKLEDGQESIKPVAFSGPKSLSDILQAKHKGENDAVSMNPIRSQITQGGLDNMVTDNEYVTSTDKSTRNNNEAAEDNGDAARDDMVGEEELGNSMEIDNLPLDARRLGDNYELKIVTDAFGLENKLSLELEEDEEYTVDDEDDDFVKKLGGFFS